MKAHLLLWMCVFGMQGIFAQSFVAGQRYAGPHGYVEYQAGNLPILISVPHGGYLQPAVIPNRNCTGCSYSRDSYTQELSRLLSELLEQRTGCVPHMVINLLHRRKFDANRDIGEAADGDLTVEASWYAYHQFLDSAKARMVQEFGRGLFIDMHGHAHTIQRVELGYTLSKSELQLPDSILNQEVYVEESSIKHLVSHNLRRLTHAELLRGPQSLGSMLTQQGIPTVPSEDDPFPLTGEPYFSGGYNTQRHGSRGGGQIDGIQIECHQSIRFDSVARGVFADSLSMSLIRYIQWHYESGFPQNACRAVVQLEAETNPISIQVYPNPVTTHLWLKGLKTGYHIQLFDVLGHMVWESIWEGEGIAVEKLPRGMYYLKFGQKGAQNGGIWMMKENAK
ncbi:MAG: T9SS type A sorting domain-containing protein [Bacteroidota bacterium]